MAIDIRKFPFLSHKDATEFSQQVLQESELWHRRAKGVDYYTLGAAYYLDLNPYQTANRYQYLAHKYNPTLWKRFEPLYRHLANYCSDQFGGIFAFHEKLALPGFHIFGPKPLAEPGSLNHFFQLILHIIS